MLSPGEVLPKLRSSIVAHFIEGLRQTNGLLVGVGSEQRFEHESPRGAEPEAAFA
jgi:hypothetical protein